MYACLAPALLTSLCGTSRAGSTRTTARWRCRRTLQSALPFSSTSSAGPFASSAAALAVLLALSRCVVRARRLARARSRSHSLACWCRLSACSCFAGRCCIFATSLRWLKKHYYEDGTDHVRPVRSERLLRMCGRALLAVMRSALTLLLTLHRWHASVPAPVQVAEHAPRRLGQCSRRGGAARALRGRHAGG